jgi:anti-sigma-K factor RskA
MTPDRLDHAAVDELAAAFALGALTPDEERAVAEHLATCEQPHTEARSLVGAGSVLAASLDPVTPSASLRDRILASAAATPQERVGPEAQQRGLPGAAPPAVAPPARRGWFDWLSPGLSRGIAAMSVAAALVLAIWNVGLQTQVGDANRITQALADARVVYPVTGDAGQGLLLDTPDGPLFLAARLERPPAGRLYELWIIGADGVPVDVGVVTETDRVALVPVEGDLEPGEVFAVTVETSRVPAPTSDPVLIAVIGG